jgi:DNA-binding NarL/FixJ family response regulator
MIRVLVVDDHAVVRTGLRAILAAAPDLACVGTAADQADALRQVESQSPDVVLLDMSMPGANGVSVTRELRRSGQNVGILVLSGFCEPGLVLEVVEAGADGYLLKDSSGERILDGVREVAAGRAPVDPTVAHSLLTELRGRGQSDILTDRERQVLELLRSGHGNRSIARHLQITERTVKAHVSHILQRIGVPDRTQAALWAERHLQRGSTPGGQS